VTHLARDCAREAKKLAKENANNVELGVRGADDAADDDDFTMQAAAIGDENVKSRKVRGEDGEKKVKTSKKGVKKVVF
jgi:hypothetical protein